MPYPENLIKPMREDLTRFGVQETRTIEEVDKAVTSPGTVMVVVGTVVVVVVGVVGVVVVSGLVLTTTSVFTVDHSKLGHAMHARSEVATWT